MNRRKTRLERRAFPDPQDVTHPAFQWHLRRPAPPATPEKQSNHSYAIVRE
jgi:hypothetical protein